MTYPGSTTYPGATIYPGGSSAVASVISFPYLGKPGSMQRLPSANGSLTATPGMGETVHTALSGGQSITARLYQKRTFSLPFDHLFPDDADQILGFYLRLFGFGPFVFVDPSVRNVLGLDSSTVGVRSQAALEWVASAGTLTRASGPPTDAPESGVLTWSSLVASATLQPGVTANTANPAKAPVYLPLEPVTVSLYAKASAAATVSLQATGYDSAGAVQVTSAATSMSLTTSWQRFTVTVAAQAAAFASAAFVLPRLVLGASVPTSVSIAGTQVEYADTASGFQPGFGSPRVTITSSPGREVPQLGYSTHTMTLGEV